MKSFLITLLLLGIIIGPGYWLASKNFSGELIKEETVFSYPESFLLSALKKLSGKQAIDVSKGDWNLPVEIELTPEMNPVSILAQTIILKTYTHNSDLAKFDLTLSYNGEQVWADTLTQRQAKKDKDADHSLVDKLAPEFQDTTFHVDTLDIQKAGTYVLDVSRVSKDQVLIESLTLEFRRNVHIPVMAVVYSGVAMIFLSIIGFNLLPKSKKEEQ